MTPSPSPEPKAPLAPSSSTPPSEAAPSVDVFHGITAMGPYLRAYTLPGVLCGLGMVLEEAFAAAIPVSFKFIIDDAIVPGNGRLLAQLLGLLALGFTITTAVAFTLDFAWARLGARVMADLQRAMYAQLSRLSLGYFFENRTGDIVARFTADFEAVDNAVMNTLPIGAAAVLSLVIHLGTMAWLEPRLALLSLLSLPLCLLGPHALRTRTSLANDEAKVASGHVAAMVQETVGAQAVVKAYNLESRMHAQFGARSLAFERASARTSALNYLMERTPIVGIMLFGVIIIGVGSVMVLRGHLSIGALVTFESLASHLGVAVGGIASLMPQMLRASAGMRRIDDLMNAVPAIVDPVPPAELPPPKSAIELRNVTFGYKPGTPNLRDATLTIPCGSRVAFVGPSGSGKSTIIGLLLRFYDPEMGSLCIDGVNLRSVTMASLRAHIGIVLQESFLFHLSLRENIRMGNSTATDADIERAAKAAGIHEGILKLPGGYDFVVGERGAGLSGGQRQRIAIARALVREPSILILDEATSALDPVSEAAILETIDGISKGRTVLSITHRLASAATADLIFVVEGGQIVERGSHQELVSLDGLYAKLLRKQSGFSVSPDGETAHVSVERLRSLGILGSLPEDLLQELRASLVTEKFLEGATVVRQGASGNRFYIVARGKLDVFHKDESGRERRINVLDDGDHFGEVALLRDVPRTATVVAREQSTLLWIHREAFEWMLAKAPGARARLEAALSTYMGRDPSSPTTTSKAESPP